MNLLIPSKTFNFLINWFEENQNTKIVIIRFEVSIHWSKDCFAVEEGKQNKINYETALMLLYSSIKILWVLFK